MATEIAKESVASTMPEGTNIHQATDVISGIINRTSEPVEQAPVQPVPPQQVEPLETPDEVVEEIEEAPDEPRMEATEEAPEQVQDTQETESEVSASDAAEIELEPAQLASLLGLEEQDLVIGEDGRLAVSAKVDGEAATVALSDLRDSYQMTKTAQQRLSKLGEERKVFNEERRQALENLGKQGEAMANAIAQMEAEYTAEWQNVDWNRLREEDQTEYNLKRADFTDRSNRLAAYKQHFDQQRAEALQKAQAYQAQLIEDGRQRLEEAMSGPEYANAPPWDEGARKELVDFMVNEGVPIELIQSTPVWQAFNWARKAMLYDKTLKEAKQTAKRVVKLPKVSKPGAQKTKAQVKQSRNQEAKRAQRKAGGSLQATADRISAIMRGS